MIIELVVNMENTNQQVTIKYPVTGKIIVCIDEKEQIFDDVDEVRFNVSEGILPKNILTQVLNTVGGF